MHLITEEERNGVGWDENRPLDNSLTIINKANVCCQIPGSFYNQQLHSK